MKREVDYKKVYKRLRQYFNLYAEVPSVRYRAREVLDYMTEIRKQCTKKKKREGK